MISSKKLFYEYVIGNKRYPVLRDINLEIDQGEMVAITGHSGSGKSTLLYLLGGMLQLQKGEIYINNVNISQMSKEELAYFRNQQIGFIFQQFHLLPGSSVLNNILLPTAYPIEIKLNRQINLIEKAEILAKQLGIGKLLNKLPNQLSGGEQQRVVIARALINDSNFIIADEPTGNLDSKNAEQILNLLKLLNKQGKTIVIVTHENHIANETKRIIHLSDGQIIYPKKVICGNFKNNLIDNFNNSLNTNGEKNIENKARSFTGYFNELTKSNIITINIKLIPNAIANLKRKKSQSILTMIGIIIGISSIVSMVTLGQFSKEKILKSYETLGSNSVGFFGYPNFNQTAMDHPPAQFEGFNYHSDLQILKKIFPQITLISPYLYSFSPFKVTFAGRKSTQGAKLVGINSAYLNIASLKLVKGSNITDYDVSSRSPVCIINDMVNQELFNRINPIGKMLYLSKNNSLSSCKIIGLLAAKHTGINKQKEPQVMVPFTVFESIGTLSKFEKKMFSFVIKVKNTNRTVVVSQAVKNYFRYKYGKSAVFYVEPNVALLSQMRKFLNIFTLILASIAITSLIVAGIGITNMMLVSITDRLKEIGLRKALGATDNSIKHLYLIEAIILCSVAGVIGIIIGIACYQSIIYFASKFIKSLTFEWYLSPVAISLSLISIISVAILSSIIPAKRAAKLEITTCLRSE